ncbi:AraC family transcriptional regulator [Arachidicoccus ginsenosidimutans]|uniref:helix-turn-helix domain-containing protein n=1 Tax=Arachidicoccus sp. BS20 TaxID=1850526 RepID=UPI0007F0C2DB|nr:AraC family transcriptional regulator [Arachidicoccus sp. BS20]ANI87845.1 AraC family transcriptional regulator [Arachidicoccus sp. BS20]
MYQYESNYKKLGYQLVTPANVDEINIPSFRPYIKVLLVPKGYSLTVDFNVYETVKPALFFINANQLLNILKADGGTAHMLYYNRDFYCVQIHDAEVACDGLLFNNIFQIPKTELSTSENGIVKRIFDNIIEELALGDIHSEEMIRIRLKEMIIHATRLWKKQNLSIGKEHTINADTEMVRNFGRLVEIHFREKHTVADYADLMGMAPKTLTNKFNKLKLDNPNEFIKNRILLEAKRLLAYTELSVKEIAYELGYDDPAYFNRLFAQKTKIAPAGFRKGFV